MRSETKLGPRKVARGQRHAQAETKPTSLTLHISLLEARDLALGRGSPPVCTEAHTQTAQPARRRDGLSGAGAVEPFSSFRFFELPT